MSPAVSGGVAAPRGRSLVWFVAGVFLLAVIVAGFLQGLAVLAVMRPIEARETRARAELAVSSVASEYASAPAVPVGADLDSLLRRQHRLRAIRPAVLAVRFTDGTVATWPPEFGRRVLADSSRGTNDRERSEIVASQPLTRGGRRVGEVLVMRRARPPGFPGADPATMLLYFPIAALLAGILALLLVRLLARRLRALEELASRVAAGDLSARVADPHGDEIGRVAAQLDRMAERLAAARDAIEANDRQRRQLFADITHELATPLTSIRGAAETLLNPQVGMSPEERTRYVRGVLEESRRLGLLTRDLVELARLEAGATPLERERLDWAALCRNTIERLAPRFAAADLHVSLRLPAGEAWVEADGLRLEQVLDNLLINALRYVPAGGHVTVSLERADGASMRWRMTVSDDGPGLPPAELPHVFERFYRGGVARGSGNGPEAAGSGLGLAIVRQIIERHGGAVRAHAATPRGLAIDVELPCIA